MTDQPQDQGVASSTLNWGKSERGRMRLAGAGEGRGGDLEERRGARWEGGEAGEAGGRGKKVGGEKEDVEWEEVGKGDSGNEGGGSGDGGRV